MKSSLFTFCAWLLESIQAERQTVDIIVTVPFNRTDSFGEIYPFSRYFVYNEIHKFGRRKISYQILVDSNLDLKLVQKNLIVVFLRNKSSKHKSSQNGVLFMR